MVNVEKRRVNGEWKALSWELGGQGSGSQRVRESEGQRVRGSGGQRVRESEG